MIKRTNKILLIINIAIIIFIIILTYIDKAEAKNAETIIKTKTVTAYVEVDVKTNLNKESEINLLSPIYEQYPVAQDIWDYMKSQNWSDEVCAGILGNMMTEAGGQTLDIQWDIYNSIRHYGICQWSPKWYPEVMGVSLLEQLDFMYYNMPKEFEVFGKNYYNGFTLDDFLFLETPEEVADAFAKIYERCGNQSTLKRQENARIAYDYFTQGIQPPA